MFSHPNQNMVGRHTSRRQQTSIGAPRQRIDGGVLLIVRTEKFTPGVFLIFWIVLVTGVGGAGQTPKTNPGLTTDGQTSAAQRLPFHAGDVPLKLMLQFEGQPTRHIFVVSVCTTQERYSKKRGTKNKSNKVGEPCLGEKQQQVKDPIALTRPPRRPIVEYAQRPNRPKPQWPCDAEVDANWSKSKNRRRTGNTEKIRSKEQSINNNITNSDVASKVPNNIVQEQENTATKLNNSTKIEFTRD